MGIFRKMREGWRMMSVKEKVDTVIDILVGVGCGVASISATEKLSEGKGVISKITVYTAMSGLSLAAGEVAARELHEAYGTPIANAITRHKARSAAQEKAKEVVNP